MLSITVNYAWSEYIKIITEFFPINSYQEKHGKCPTSPIKISFFDNIIAHLLGSLIFLIKVKKVGVCHFSFSELGFQRKSNVDDKFIVWDKVLRIHKLTEAYLLELEQGFIPLPYKFFNDNKLEFEQLIAHKFSTQ